MKEDPNRRALRPPPKSGDAKSYAFLPHMGRFAVQTFRLTADSENETSSGDGNAQSRGSRDSALSDPDRNGSHCRHGRGRRRRMRAPGASSVATSLRDVSAMLYVASFALLG